MRPRWLELFGLYTRDAIAEGWTALAPLVDGFELLGPLAPDALSRAGSPGPISAAAARRELAATGELNFSRRDRDPDLFLSWRRSPLSPRSPLHLYGRLPLAGFAGDAGLANALGVRRYLARTAGYGLVYGWAHPHDDRMLGTDPHFENPAADKRLYEAYWLTLLGAGLVATIGAARLAGLEVGEVTELAGGAVMIATGASPDQALSDPARDVQSRVLGQLRDGVDVAATRAVLADRSRRLAPVDRTWDPDLVELLDHTLRWVPLAARRERELELDDYRPPAVAWQPAAGIAPDVDDPAACLAEYRELAEGFVAGMHAQIDGLHDDAPACLIALDRTCWRRDYSRQRARPAFRDRLVPGLGAFVGQTLVDQLGGRWVPRRDRARAVVVVGARAYQPFARAEQYLASRQAVIDYSMTKLFREAARHR